jgi:hypothetical protein
MTKEKFIEYIHKLTPDVYWFDLPGRILHTRFRQSQDGSNYQLRYYKTIEILNKNSITHKTNTTIPNNFETKEIYIFINESIIEMRDRKINEILK